MSGGVKQSLYFPEDMLAEMQRGEAARPVFVPDRSAGLAGRAQGFAQDSISQ